jgi:hypothetical protein
MSKDQRMSTSVIASTNPILTRYGKSASRRCGPLRRANAPIWYR